MTTPGEALVPALLVPDEAWAWMTLWAEARGEPFEGLVGVAEVIRNRTIARFRSTGTIASTCLWPLQFSCWNAHDPNRLKMAELDRAWPAVARCLLAWERAAAGSDLSHSALFYFNPNTVRPAWAKDYEETGKLGRHLFMRPRPR